MPFDVNDKIVQNILNVLHIVLIYISKLGIWIGSMIVSGKISKTIINKKWERNLPKIAKSVSLLLASILLYLLLA